MKNSEMISILGVLSVMAVMLPRKLRLHSSSLDADTIGNYFNKGFNGVVFRLKNDDVLKIVTLENNMKENIKQSQFIDEYIKNTESGVWSKCEQLPEYHYYNKGYASQFLLDELEDEGIKDYIEYNDEIAAWVTANYNTTDKVLEPYVRDAKKSLKEWGTDYGINFSDLHEGNYGLDKNNNVVFFDYNLLRNDNLPKSM